MQLNLRQNRKTFVTQITRGSDVNMVSSWMQMSIPTQLLTSKGRKQIVEAYENLGRNSMTAWGGAYKMTPMGISRMIDERNGDAGMPSLVPSLGREDAKTGKDFVFKDGLYKEKLDGTNTKSIGDGTIEPHGIFYKNSNGKYEFNQYDSNPLLQALWHVVPGFSSFTKWHDKSVDTGQILPQNKVTSIPGYLATSLYGSVGTPVNSVYDYFFNKPNVQSPNIDNISK